MSDLMLQGILNMPIELWGDEELDKQQRHSRYIQASKRIKDQQNEIDILKFSLFKYVDIQDQLENLTGNLWPQNETTEKMGEIIKQYTYLPEPPE